VICLILLIYIENHVVEFYTNLYDVPNDCVDNGFVSKVILKLVFNEDNNLLYKLPYVEKVKSSVFYLNKGRAPQLGSFSGAFYQFSNFISQIGLCQLSIFFLL